MKPSPVGSWTLETREAPWTPRDSMGHIVYDGKMWIMAGGSYVDNIKGNEHIAYNDVWSSTNGADWELETGSAAWSPRSSATAIVFDDRMWMIGGMGWGDERKTLHDVWYSDNGKEWKLATDYPPWCARSMQTTVVLDEKLWVIGADVMTKTYMRIRL